MSYKVTIQTDDQTIYEQTVEQLDMKGVINAVNPANKVPRKPRSDTGKRRRFDASEDPAGSIDSLV